MLSIFSIFFVELIAFRWGTAKLAALASSTTLGPGEEEYSGLRTSSVPSQSQFQRLPSAEPLPPPTSNLNLNLPPTRLMTSISSPSLSSSERSPSTPIQASPKRDRQSRMGRPDRAEVNTPAAQQPDPPHPDALLQEVDAGPAPPPYVDRRDGEV